MTEGKSEQPTLSPEQVRRLLELDAAIRTGRNVVWALVRMGALTTAGAMLVYYVFGALNGWHTWSGRQ